MYCPIWVKFAVRHLHVMLLSILEFGENRRREGRTFLMGVNEITWTRVPLQRFDIQKVKKALVNSVLRHGLRHLRSCYQYIPIVHFYVGRTCSNLYGSCVLGAFAKFAKSDY
jgi:hypothetical protein